MVYKTIQIFIFLFISTTCLTYCEGARGKLNLEVVERSSSSSAISVNQYYHKEAFLRKQEAECNIDSGTSPQPEKWRGHGPELAGIKVYGTGMRSVRAKLAIYQPTDVDIGEYSSSIVSVEAGNDLAYTLIQAGWTVNPCLYNDTKVHFFMYQFVDSGFCLDGGCKEFVVQNSGLKFGDVLTPSEVGYDPQTFLEIYIAQDQTSGDWYLNANSKRIGYWQWGNTTFESLKEGATTIRIGGEAYTPRGWDSSPTMGTGVMMAGMKTRTCFVDGIKINSDESGNGGYLPQNPEVIETRCFFVADPGSTKWFTDYGFFFGGKGGKDQDYCVYHANRS